MTIKNQIIEILGNKELTLKEMFILLPSIKPSSIMGCINGFIKTGNVFERTGKGKYKLKQ